MLEEMMRSDIYENVNEQEQDRVVMFMTTKHLNRNLRTEGRKSVWQFCGTFAVFTAFFSQSLDGIRMGWVWNASFFFFMSMHEMLYTPPLTNLVTFELEFEVDGFLYSLVLLLQSSYFHNLYASNLLCESVIKYIKSIKSINYAVSLESALWRLVKDVLVG